MIRFVIHCFILCLPTCLLYGGVNNSSLSQELAPIDSGYTDHTPEYPIAIQKILLQKTSFIRNREFQFLVLPPFTSERLLTVFMEGTNYMAEVMKPEEMIWTNLKDTSGIKVSSVKKEIPKHIAERASLLWARMLIRAEFQKGYSYPDAQFYCFFKLIPHWGTLGGECVFQNGTRSSMLAGIGLLLEDYVNTASNDEQKIASEIESLMEKLDAALISDTSVEQEGKFRTVAVLLEEQAKDAEHDRLWSEKMEIEYRNAREAALAEMRKKAVRFGKTGYWDKEGTYRPYP